MSGTIVWAHGWAMSSDAWREIGEARLPEARHVWVDFGRCSTMSDCVDAIVRAAGGERDVTLAGWSLGGMLAIEAAFALKHRLAGLALIAPTLRFASSDRQLGWHPRVLDRMLAALEVEPAAVVRQFRERMLAGAELEPPRRERLLGGPVGFTAEGLADGLRYLRDADLAAAWAALAEDSARAWPIVAIHGEADEIVRPLPLALDGKRGDRALRLPGTGHLPFAEREAETYDAIRSLLDGYR